MADAILQRNSKTLEHNWPRKAAAEISCDPGKLLVIADMKWWLRQWDRKKILIGDRPLLTYPPAPYPCGMSLRDPKCLIMLPVGPDVVFFACGNSRPLNGQPPLSKIAHLVNGQTLARVRQTVFAANTAMRDFVLARMRDTQTNYPLLADTERAERRLER
jgi:hypothetical protein